MLSFFKKNSFFNSIMLLVYTIFLQIIPLIMGQQSSDLFHSSIATSIVHILILFVQAIFINRLIIENRMHRDIMLFPGLFFILYSSAMPFFWQYQHIHTANFFVIWSLYELFKIYKTSDPAIHIFNASFLIGIASLICPGMLFYLLLIFLGISNLKKMELVHPLQILIGCFVPLFLWVTYLVYTNKENNIFEWLGSHYGVDFFSFSKSHWIYTGIYALIGLLLLISYNEIRKKKHIQAQKKVDIIYLSFITSALILLFHSPADGSSYLFSAPYIGILIGLLISHVRNFAMAELIHLILFIGIILTQIFTFFKFE